MKQIIILLIALHITNDVFTQNFIPLNYDTLQRKQEINLNASGELSTSSIQTALSSKFIFGGNISNELINKNVENHKKLNRIGGNAETTIDYINYNVQPFKKVKWGIIAKAGLFANAGVRYREGVFGLAFTGNEPYLGKTIDLSNMFASYLVAHKIGFGFIDAVSKSSVTINVYGVTNYVSGHLNNASFSQNADGYQAALQAEGRAYVANTSPYYKGLGVGIDANFFFKIGHPEKPSYIQFNVQNLGVAFLNKNVKSYSINTNFKHDGYTIANILDGETLFSKDKKITEELGIGNDTIKRNVALPFTVNVAKIIDEHNLKPLQFYYGMRIYVQNAAIPMGYFGLHYRSKKWFRMGAGASYGGFAGLRMNLYAQAKLENFSVGLASSDFVGLTGIGRGYGLSLNLHYSF